MFSLESFRAASERAEGWLGLVSQVARLGEGGSVDAAYQLLDFLQDEYHQHYEVLDEASSKLMELSDGRVEWPKDRGWSGVIPSGTVLCWSRPHEAAVGLTRLALQTLVWPLEKITDPVEQRARAQHLFGKWWKALTLPGDELAALQERIRREREVVGGGAGSQGRRRSTAAG